MGGYDLQDSLTSTIYRLPLANEATTWQSVKITLPKPICSVGLHQLADDSIMIFGGRRNNATTCDMMLLVQKARGQMSIRMLKDKSGNL